jgi:hypothetical protein
VGTREAPSFRELVPTYCILALFAVMLALLTSRHEMYLDEVNPWLVVRNVGLSGIFPHLRYEGHPAVWFLLLYAASRFTSNLIAIQSINFICAMLFAYQVLLVRKLPLLVRVLLLFGVSVFFTMGVLARSYMLTGLLLITAARILLAEPQRKWIAMILLALAINTHFLAIPIAANIYLWLYWLAPDLRFRSLGWRFKDQGFRLSFALMLSALGACYFTVRPARDVVTHYAIQGASFFDYAVLSVGRICHYLLPISIDASSSIQNGRLTPHAYADVLITLLLWFVLLAILKGRRSRYFMITASVTWMIVILPTVRIPNATHSSFLIVVFIISLFISAYEVQSQSWIPQYAAQPILIVFLAMQVLICAQFCYEERSRPFSSGKAVAQFLEREGLTSHPLVVQPEIAGPAVMAYAHISSAYFPACACSRSFIRYSTGWDSERSVTAEELHTLQASTGKSPVVLSHWPINDQDQEQLGIHLAYVSPKSWAFNNEDVYVYRVVGSSGGL